MTAKTDDLEAVRLLVDTLQPFTTEDRERIIRWAREKLGMATAPGPGTQPALAINPLEVPGQRVVIPAPAGNADIKSFVTQKAPKSDVHFAATIAYYHQFVAPADRRKVSITSDDLIEACRLVPRKQPKRPAQVLVNAYHDGLLDRAGTGHYKLNAVGENLVTMALPTPVGEPKGRKKTARGRQKTTKRKKRSARKGR